MPCLRPWAMPQFRDVLVGAEQAIEARNAPIVPSSNPQANPQQGVEVHVVVWQAVQH